MEFQQVESAMTFDELSLERSKNFVKALQELKNLRPQLYSASEYCEKSYLHSEQKQMVLDNLKDYAVRALVNAVDHIGTVAYKLNDLLEQQTADVSAIELKVSCLNQQLLTCQTYTDKEGIRQQQLLTFIPRHHKHYILPNSVNKKVHFSPHIQTDARHNIQTRSRPQHAGVVPAAKTLSWHLASETKSTLKPTSRTLMSGDNAKSSGKNSPAFHLLDSEGSHWTSSAHLQLSASSAAMQPFGATRKDSFEGSKSLATFRSFETPDRRENVHAPVRSKSMLSAFFVKQKTPKLKVSSVS